jgi:long-chain fatty acid transport protein
LRPSQTRRLWLLISFVTLMVSQVAFGSGFGFFEQGAKAVGMGGAFAATADDPSAIFYNPAGIAYQRKMAGMAGATFVTFANEFEGDPNDPFTSGVKEYYQHHFFALPNSYLVVPVGENMTFGVGLFTPFGLRTNWEHPNRYSGRFISQDANVKSISVQPTFAWKTSSGKFAIGIGAEYKRAHIILARNNAAFNPFTGRIADVVHARLNSDWDTTWGYDVGLMFKPTPTWSIGLSYRADNSIDFKGDADFTQIPTGNAQFDALVGAGIPPDQKIATTINFPSIAALGIATTAIPNWQIEADITKTSWSDFKSLDVTFLTTPSANIHRPQNWHDTYSYRVGGNRKLTDRWQLQLGFLYDENPQPTEGVGPLLPDSNRVGPSMGLGWHGEHFSVEASELFLHFLTRSTMGINTDNYNGRYKTDANLITVNFGYKF